MFMAKKREVLKKANFGDLIWVNKIYFSWIFAYNFTLETGIWSQCQLKGKGPEARSRASSFIFQDNFYVYGGTEKKNAQINHRELFVLNLSKFLALKNSFLLDTLVWSKLEQQVEFLARRHEINLSTHIYHDHLILLGDGCGDKETLFLYDISKNFFALKKPLKILIIVKNEWSTFQVGNIGLSSRYGRLFVYKNLLLAFGIHGGLCMAILNLESNISLFLSLNPFIRHWNASIWNIRKEGFKIIIYDWRGIWYELSSWRKNLSCS